MTRRIKVVILITTILYSICALFFYSLEVGIIAALLMPPALPLGLALMAVAVLFVVTGFAFLIAASIEVIWNTYKWLRRKVFREGRKAEDFEEKNI